MAEIRLRRANSKDCTRLWRWRNEKEVRNLSFRPEKVSYGSHRKWFAEKLASSRAVLLIGENGWGMPFGHVRLDLIPHRTAEVHLMVKRAARNRGLGQLLLSRTCHYGFHRLRLHSLVARVYAHNTRSVHLFKKMGFFIRKTARINGKDVCVMRKEKV